MSSVGNYQNISNRSIALIKGIPTPSVKRQRQSERQIGFHWNTLRYLKISPTPLPHFQASQCISLASNLMLTLPLPLMLDARCGHILTDESHKCTLMLLSNLREPDWIPISCQKDLLHYSICKAEKRTILTYKISSSVAKHIY